MARRLVNIDRETPLLLPPSIQEWLDEDDMARFIVDAVEAVADDSCRYNWNGTGSKQYPPRMMLALLIHCYASGVFSSRRIERATWRDIAVRYITGDHHPDHDTIASFRRENQALFKACFLRVLELAREMKICRVGDVAIDGSKIEASAAKRRTYTYKAMKEATKALDLKISQLIAAAEKSDASDAKAADGTRLPGPLADAEQRRDEMKRAMELIEERKKQAAAARDKERDDHDHSGPGEPPRPLKPEAEDKDTINLTDPDARLLPQKKGGYHPSYNVQLSVQAACAVPIILATHVSDEGNDRRLLAPMVAKTLNHQPTTQRVLVDTGYDNSAQIHQIEKSGKTIVYCPPEEPLKKKELAATTRQSKARKRTMNYREGMRACMAGSFGQTSQRLRGTTVEPVFGWIKSTLKFSRFHLRGLSKVSLEWDLVCLGFNMKMLHREWRRGMLNGAA